MTAEALTATITDAIPNLGFKMVVARVTCTENDDWVDMSDYMSIIYFTAGFDVTNGAAEAITVTGTKCIMAAGGTDTITIMAMGI